MSGSKGFSLAELVVTLALSLLVVLAGAAVTKIYGSSSRYLMKRTEANELSQKLARVLTDSSVCSCIVDPLVNKDSSGQLLVDTTAPQPQDIALKSIHSDCDYSTAANVLVQSDSIVSDFSRLFVDKISLTNLRPISDSAYLSDLKVVWKSGDGPLAAVSFPMMFEIDTAAGAPTARPTKKCVSVKATPSMGMATCPSTMILFGTPGMRGTFCVEPSLHAPMSAPGSVAFCNAIVHEGRHGSICDDVSLLNLCVSGTFPGMSSNWEFALSDPPGVGVFGGTCTGTAAFAGYSLPFRCCIY